MWSAHRTTATCCSFGLVPVARHSRVWSLESSPWRARLGAKSRASIRTDVVASTGRVLCRPARSRSTVTDLARVVRSLAARLPSATSTNLALFVHEEHETRRAPQRPALGHDMGFAKASGKRSSTRCSTRARDGRRRENERGAQHHDGTGASEHASSTRPVTRRFREDSAATASAWRRERRRPAAARRSSPGLCARGTAAPRSVPCGRR